MEIYNKLDRFVFGKISFTFKIGNNITHSNNACNIQRMVHYHQQALQIIMFLNIFEVFLYNGFTKIAITNPVCKTCSIIFLKENSWPSHAMAFKSFFRIGQGL